MDSYKYIYIYSYHFEINLEKRFTCKICRFWYHD